MILPKVFTHSFGGFSYYLDDVTIVCNALLCTKLCIMSESYKSISIILNDRRNNIMKEYLFRN